MAPIARDAKLRTGRLMSRRVGISAGTADAVAVDAELLARAAVASLARCRVAPGRRAMIVARSARPYPPRRVWVPRILRRRFELFALVAGSARLGGVAGGAKSRV